MKTVDQTFDEINVPDIFWNILTNEQRQDLCSHVSKLIDCRNIVKDAIELKSRAIYTCHQVAHPTYEKFIGYAIERSSSFNRFPRTIVLSVDTGSSCHEDNKLRVKVLESLIGQIRIYQSKILDTQMK